MFCVIVIFLLFNKYESTNKLKIIATVLLQTLGYKVVK